MALYIGGSAVDATAAELNILDGVTSTAAELNIMDGVTSTAAELNYSDGVTSAIQTQMDTKGTGHIQRVAHVGNAGYNDDEDRLLSTMANGTAYLASICTQHNFSTQCSGTVYCQLYNNSSSSDIRAYLPVEGLGTGIYLSGTQIRCLNTSGATRDINTSVFLWK